MVYIYISFNLFVLLVFLEVSRFQVNHWLKILFFPGKLPLSHTPAPPKLNPWKMVGKEGRLDYFPVEFRSLFRGKTFTVYTSGGFPGMFEGWFSPATQKQATIFVHFFFCKNHFIWIHEIWWKKLAKKKSTLGFMNERMIWPQNDVVCKVYFLSNMANVAVICFQFQGVGQNQISNGIKKNMTFITP